MGAGFQSSRPAKYWDREWKDSQGVVLRSTAHRKGKGKTDPKPDSTKSSARPPSPTNTNSSSPRELMVYENVGRGPATDLLSISLSANDILGHQVGPDSPEMQQMALDLDRELAGFINFLGHQIGLANVWIALSADHGVSSLPDAVKKLRIPAANLDAQKLEAQINTAMTRKVFSRPSGLICKAGLSAGLARPGCFRRGSRARARCRSRRRRGHEASRIARLLHEVATRRGRSPQHRARAKISEQLFTGRKLVRNGRSRHLHRGPGKGTDQRRRTATIPTCLSPSTDCRSRPELIAPAPNPSIWPPRSHRCWASMLPAHSVGRVLTEALAPAHHSSNPTFSPERASHDRALRLPISA